MVNNLLNGIIRVALNQRVLVVSVAAVLLICGGWQTVQLPIDVFPDLNRPRVVIMTEASGLAPEEVETLITIPMETAINGATGVQSVRTLSSVGLSVIYVEFDWGTDIFNDRQIVAERLALVSESLPEGVKPQLAPISSVMGQIMILGMWGEKDATSPMELRTLADWVVRQRLLTIPGVSQVFVMGGERKQYQVLVRPDALLRFGVSLDEIKVALESSNENVAGGYLDEQGPYELLVRSLGRIRTIEQIENIVVKVRAGRPVLVGQVARVAEGAAVKRGSSAAFARDVGKDFVGGPAVVLTVNKQPEADTRQVTQQITQALKGLASSLPDGIRIEPGLYQQKQFIDLAIANVIEALRDGGILVILILFLFLLNFRTTFITLTAIPLSIVITGLAFTAWGLSINTMTLGGLAVAIGELVDDVIVDVENIYRRLRENRLCAEPLSPLVVVYRASAEIRNSIVYGTVIVVLVFIPVFALSGMEGRLFRPLGIAYIVSIVSSLLISLTVTPVLSYWLLTKKWAWFLVSAAMSPLFGFAISFWVVPAALSLFGLDALATRWSEASLWAHGLVAVVSAPILWALVQWTDRYSAHQQESPLLYLLKSIASSAIRLSLFMPWPVLFVAVAAALASLTALLRLENDFLPPFDEGAVQINAILPPGTSLTASEGVARRLEQRLQQIPEIEAFVRKTGRAELDEHAVPVSGTEIIASLDPSSPRSREEILDEIRAATADIPGVVTGVEQPLAHLISHMLSGVQAHVGIKLYGDNLGELRRFAQQIRAAIEDVPGVTDLQVEPQREIPQLRIDINGNQLRKYGLVRRDVNQFIETAMKGEVVSQILIGRQTFDLLLRLDESSRENIETLKRLSLALPDGGTTSLESVASIYRASGPNTINREQVRRRIVVQCNTSGRGLVDVVEDIRTRLAPLEKSLPTGYFIEYGGQFQSQRSASRKMFVYFTGAIVGMFLVLYTMFRSANLSLQVMFALPMAFIGSVAALYLTGQTLTVAAMVGFISLSGIATRNGILLISHYLHLVRYEGETWSRELVVRAGRERVAPVLMTALTSGMGLLPLALAAGEAGKEILYPVATVIIGGLITSTLLEFLVRPALFWKFGLAAAERTVEEERRATSEEWQVEK